MFRNIGLLALLALCSIAAARPTYVGYSGAPSSLGRCASSCHGSGVGTVQVTGFPTEYVPDSTYLLTIAAMSGSTIKNFNGSVRIGTGTTTAGQLSAGQNTITYSVAQENNGIRLSANDQQSATFLWRAPAAGVGTVRLYVAAHQGARTGPNTNITLIADEAATLLPPEIPSSPLPPNNANNQPLEVNLWWWADHTTDHCEVYLGANSSPALIDANVAGESYLISGLEPGTTYYWQVYAVNDAGSTPSPVWSFTTEAASAAQDPLIASEFSVTSAYPNPFNGLVRVSLSVPFNSPVSAVIYDRTGRQVATLLQNSLIERTVNLEWNAAGHAAGIYFLKCDCAGISHTQKLIYLP
jgi:hypothetical protein